MPNPPGAKRGRKATRSKAATPQTSETATTREPSRRRRFPTPRFDTEGTPAAASDATDPLQSEANHGVTLPPVAGPAVLAAPDTDLRQQVQSLQQTVEGLVGVVQQLATQVANQSTVAPIDATPSTSTGAVGEFTVTPAFLPRETPRPVLFAASLPTGYQVSERNKIKIWAHQYVDFQDILFNSTTEPTYTMSVHDAGNAPTLQFAPQKKWPLTETEWCTAWDDFLAVYTQNHAHDLSDLITYSRHIKDLMQSGADWGHYDRQFRVDREYSHCSWATVRVDLQLTATLKSTHTMTRNNQPFRQASQPFKANTTRQQSRPPTGYCFSYHSQSVRCTAENCQYKHVCPRCKRNHPMYRQCIPPQHQTNIQNNRTKLPHTLTNARQHPGTK